MEGSGAVLMTPEEEAAAGQYIQDIWSKETLFQHMPVLRFEKFSVHRNTVTDAKTIEDDQRIQEMGRQPGGPLFRWRPF